MSRPAGKENRKEEIFQAAVKCFNENGYYRTSMDMIAERAKITKRGLYYHFKSKDQLFIQLFHHMNRKFYERIPRSVMTDTDPEHRLLRFGKIASSALEENTDFLKFSQEFLSLSLRKPEIRKVMTSYYREQVERVQASIEKGIRAGTFAAVDPGKMARAIVLITMGAFNVFFSLDCDYDLSDQHTFDITHIVGSLKKGGLV